MYGTLPFTGGLNPLRMFFLAVALAVFTTAMIRKRLG